MDDPFMKTDSRKRKGTKLVPFKRLLTVYASEMTTSYFNRSRCNYELLLNDIYLPLAISINSRENIQSPMTISSKSCSNHCFRHLG